MFFLIGESILFNDDQKSRASTVAAIHAGYTYNYTIKIFLHSFLLNVYVRAFGESC